VSETATILGIRFAIGDARSLVALASKGGLIVVPSAPVLVASERDPMLLAALTGADLAIADSGLMVLLWLMFEGQRITRVSGLEYLRQLLDYPGLNLREEIFWVLPNETALSRLLEWLGPERAPSVPQLCYVAPFYTSGNVDDPVLLGLIERLRPSQVIIGLGGGVQEPLGYHTRNSLSYRPAIHCIGAAIGFLTGDQVRIPRWADYLFLGWLFRSLSNPSTFVPRYFRAMRLLPLMWRHRNRPRSSGQTTK
jgi:UDP-N-acetyl-D-mannosaminuronic acid transferase (WecB/TagA/CpsF family)